MGNNLFGINIGNILADNMGSLLLDASLTVSASPSAIDINDPLGDPSNAGETVYNGRGFTEEYSNMDIDGSVILRGDRRAILLSDTFPTGTPIPKDGDRVTIENNTYTIIGTVMRDPAEATWTCQGRP